VKLRKGNREERREKNDKQTNKVESQEKLIKTLLLKRKRP
jgi:hypothetical protein